MEKDAEDTHVLSAVVFRMLSEYDTEEEGRLFGKGSVERHAALLLIYCLFFGVVFGVLREQRARTIMWSIMNGVYPSMMLGLTYGAGNFVLYSAGQH